MALHFPRSCLHCETPDCVTVCPTGASYKRAEDGIVLVDADLCIGCKLCSWAVPVRRARVQRGARRDAEVHAVRGPHRQPDPRARTTASRLRAGLPRRARATSATSATPIGKCRSSSPSAAGRDLMPEFGLSTGSTSTCRRPRAQGHRWCDGCQRASARRQRVDAKQHQSNCLRWPGIARMSALERAIAVDARVAQSVSLTVSTPPARALQSSDHPASATPNQRVPAPRRQRPGTAIVATAWAPSEETADPRRALPLELRNATRMLSA
jgi:ferredoxin